MDNETNKKNNKVINLPNLKDINNRKDYIKTRALADSEALRFKCSDTNIYNNFTYLCPNNTRTSFLESHRPQFENENFAVHTKLS